MGRTARSVVDVLLGEATSGSVKDRFDDMLSIASSIANRATELGVTMDDVVSVQSEFNAFGSKLPAGVENYRSLAEKALRQVQEQGPVHPGSFYATASATRNLPKGLEPVATSKGHTFFRDPQARAIRTAVGFRTPRASPANDVAANQNLPSAFDAIFGFEPAPATAASRAADLDSVFGLETAPAAARMRETDLDGIFGLPSAQSAPAARANDLDAIFGFETPSRAAIGNVDKPSTEWDGSFSSPVSITDRVTSDFGNRAPPSGSLGIGSANHLGVDISAAPGETGYAAEAAAPGVVTSAGPSGRYGNLVEIEHPDGTRSRYGHLQSVNVEVGQQVARGAPVGTVGDTGNTKGAHLHFEVRDPLGNPVNPADLVDFTARRDTVTPASRPMSPTEQRNAASAYSGMAASMANAGVLGIGKTAPSAQGLPAGFDNSRFAGDIDPSRFGSSTFTGAQAPASRGFNEPSADRFGRTEEISTDIDSGRFGGYQYAGVQGPVSPTSPARPDNTASAGPRGSFSVPDRSAAAKQDRIAQPEPTAERFGRTASMPSADRFGYGMIEVDVPSSLPSPARPDNKASGGPKGKGWSVPSAAPSITSPGSIANIASIDPSFTSAMANYAPTASSVKAAPTPFSSTLALPQEFAPPGLPSQFNPMQVPLGLPAPRPPAPVVSIAPPPRISAAPRTTRRPDMTFGQFPPAPPTYSAMDVYSGIAPDDAVGVANDGSRVSRDRFGNTSITNGFGVTTVSTPSGRQAAKFDSDFGSLGGLGGRAKGLGSAFGQYLKNQAPEIAGSVIGGYFGGPLGSLLGGIVGSHIGPGGWHPSAPSTRGLANMTGKGRGDISDRARADIDRGKGGLY